MLLQKVYAQVGTSVSNPFGTRFDSLANVFGVIMNVIMGVSVSLAVIFLGLGGIKYITSKGDAKAAEEARGYLTNAVIGLVITLGALAIKTILFGIIGTSGPNATGIDTLIIGGNN